jgi:hypothetical protein
MSNVGKEVHWRAKKNLQDQMEKDNLIFINAAELIKNSLLYHQLESDFLSNKAKHFDFKINSLMECKLVYH